MAGTVKIQELIDMDIFDEMIGKVLKVEDRYANIYHPDFIDGLFHIIDEVKEVYNEYSIIQVKHNPSFDEVNAVMEELSDVVIMGLSMMITFLRPLGDDIDKTWLIRKAIMRKLDADLRRADWL